MQVLGIIGKMLPGPWMSNIYTYLKTQKDPIDTMNIVKGVIENLKVLTEASQIILLFEKDFFGSPLPKKDIDYLLISVLNELFFREVITACGRFKQAFMKNHSSRERFLLSQYYYR